LNYVCQQELDSGPLLQLTCQLTSEVLVLYILVIT